MAAKASAEMRAGMEDDLNTARALGAMFDLVRDVNAAADSGQVQQDNVAAVAAGAAQFDEIFAVLKDDDAAKVRGDRRVGHAEGKADKISPAAAELAKAASLSDAEVEQLVAEHSQARKSEKFRALGRDSQSAGGERHHPGEHERRRALEEEVASGRPSRSDFGFEFGRSLRRRARELAPGGLWRWSRARQPR